MAADFTVRGDTSLDGSGMQKGLSAMTVAAGNLISGLVAKVAQGVAQAVQTAVQMGVQYNAQLEQYQVAFTTLLGDAGAAAAALEAIKADAARTPFDTATLVKANQYLISTGESAEAARATINALGDAVSATGGGSDELGRMAQNLQQIKNAGKAGAMDVKQFAMAGIDVYGLLADYTGKTTAQVQKMDVTYELLSGALRAASEEGGRFYGAMDTQSQTLNGRLSTLKDNVTQLAGALTEGLTEQLGGAVEIAIGWVDTLSAAMAENGIPGVLQAARDIVTGLVGQFTENLPEMTRSGAELLISFLEGIYTNILSVTQTAADIISDFVNGISDSLPKILSRGVDVLAVFLYGISQNLPQLLDTAGRLILTLVQGLIDNFPRIAVSAISVVSTFVSYIIAHLPEILSTGAQLLGKLIDGIGSMAGFLIEKAAELVGQFIDKFTSTDWLQVGKDIISGIVDGIVSAGGSLFRTVSDLVNGMFDSAQKAADSHSPSRRAKREVGEMFSQGVAIGVEQDSGLAVSAAKRTAMEMVRAAQAQVLASQARTGSIMTGTGSAARTAFSATLNTAHTVILQADGRTLAKVLVPYLDVLMA